MQISTIIEQQDIAIHCDTEAKADTLLDYLFKHEFEWGHGNFYVNNRWDRNEYNTYYYINNNFISCGNTITNYNKRLVIPFDTIVWDSNQPNLDFTLYQY